MHFMKFNLMILVTSQGNINIKKKNIMMSDDLLLIKFQNNIFVHTNLHIILLDT